MGEVLEHKCGLVLAHSLYDTRAMLKSLQHRGREAAGIAAIGDNRIDVLKWVGKVDRFDQDDLHKIFPGKEHHTFIGHVRYATKGRKARQDILQDAHPHTIGGTVINNGDHILVLDCEAAMVHNGQIDVDSLEGIVREELKTGCDTKALLHFYREKEEKSLLRMVIGTYTLAIADKRRKEVMVIRDRTGNRLGRLGIKGEKYCVATEDVAIRKNGGKAVTDIEPGCVYYFDHNGQFRKERIIDTRNGALLLAYCMFEHGYLASPESVINGVSVLTFREEIGVQLAMENKFEGIDFVTYAPRSPEAAARRYAEELGVPFIEVFYKPNADRSFMESTQEERTSSIDANLFLIPHIIPFIRRKRILVIDDSLVRGTVVNRIRHLLFDVAQVESAALYSYIPPIGIIGEDGLPRGCTFGVDMPPSEEKFIARMTETSGAQRNASPEEINAKAGMPVFYLSRDGLNKVFDKVGLPHNNMCMYCIGGKEPFPQRASLPVIT